MRLFVTSREALRVTGEHELDLPPLVDDDAVALFLEVSASIDYRSRSSSLPRG